MRIPADEPPPQPVQPAEDDLDLDREIEYAFDTDEPMLGRPPVGDVASRLIPNSANVRFAERLR